MQLDDNIRHAKLQFGINIGRIFAYCYPDLSSCEMMRIELDNYLTRIAYFLVGN